LDEKWLGLSGLVVKEKLFFGANLIFEEDYFGLNL
jgi:hypothetical protein